MKVRVMTASGFTKSRDDRVQWWRDTHDAKVFDDVDRNGVMWNHLQILEDILESRESHALVVQDDAIPLKGWEHHLNQVVKTAPTYPVSLCHFQERGRKLWVRGYSYGTATNCVWGQAVLYSRDFVKEYVQTVRDLYTVNPLQWQTSDDGVLVVHNLISGNKSCFTTRALFDHADGPSTLGHLSKGRRPGATIENTPGQWTTRTASHSLSITSRMRRSAEMVKGYREQ